MLECLLLCPCPPPSCPCLQCSYLLGPLCQRSAHLAQRMVSEAQLHLIIAEVLPRVSAGALQWAVKFGASARRNVQLRSFQHVLA